MMDLLIKIKIVFQFILNIIKTDDIKLFLDVGVNFTYFPNCFCHKTSWFENSLTAE